MRRWMLDRILSNMYDIEAAIGYRLAPDPVHHHRDVHQSERCGRLHGSCGQKRRDRYLYASRH